MPATSWHRARCTQSQQLFPTLLRESLSLNTCQGHRGITFAPNHTGCMVAVSNACQNGEQLRWNHPKLWHTSFCWWRYWNAESITHSKGSVIKDSALQSVYNPCLLPSKKQEHNLCSSKHWDKRKYYYYIINWVLLPRASLDAMITKCEMCGSVDLSRPHGFP